MVFNLLLSFLHTAEPLGRVLHQQLITQIRLIRLILLILLCDEDTHPSTDVLCLLTDGLGVADIVIRDGGEQLLLVLPVEGRLAHQHLVHQHAVRPPVHTLAVRLVADM